jgi:hypothetical protein
VGDKEKEKDQEKEKEKDKEKDHDRAPVNRKRTASSRIAAGVGKQSGGITVTLLPLSKGVEFASYSIVGGPARRNPKLRKRPTAEISPSLTLTITITRTRTLTLTLTITLPQYTLLALERHF